MGQQLEGCKAAQKRDKNGHGFKALGHGLRAVKKIGSYAVYKQSQRGGQQAAPCYMSTKKISPLDVSTVPLVPPDNFILGLTSSEAPLFQVT